MVLLETAFIAGIGYTAYSAWKIRRSVAANEGVQEATGGATGIEFCKETHQSGFPILINTGLVVLPLFNIGDSRDEESLYSQWRLDDGTLIKGMRTREDNGSRAIHVADTEQELQALMGKHEVVTRPFSNVTPIIAYSYAWAGRPVWYDVKAGVISTNKQWVALHAALARRPVGAFTVFAGLAVLAAGEAIKHSYSSVLPCKCLACKYNGRKI